MCFIVRGEGLPQEGVIYLNFFTNFLHIVSRLLPENFVEIHYQWPEILRILKNSEYREVELPQDGVRYFNFFWLNIWLNIWLTYGLTFFRD